MHCAYPYAHCVHLLAHCKHASLSTLVDCIYEKMQLRVAAKHHDRDAQRIPLWAYASHQGKHGLNQCWWTPMNDMCQPLQNCNLLGWQTSQRWTYVSSIAPWTPENKCCINFWQTYSHKSCQRPPQLAQPYGRHTSIRLHGETNQTPSAAQKGMDPAHLNISEQWSRILVAKRPRPSKLDNMVTLTLQRNQFQYTGTCLRSSRLFKLTKGVSGLVIVVAWVQHRKSHQSLDVSCKGISFRGSCMEKSACYGPWPQGNNNNFGLGEGNRSKVILSCRRRAPQVVQQFRSLHRIHFPRGINAWHAKSLCQQRIGSHPHALSLREL